MKRFILIIILISTFKCYSQYQQYEKPDLIDIDTFYKNKKEYLIYEGIYKFKTLLTKDELKHKFKNIAGAVYNNLNNVITAETDDQIVINYITPFTVRNSGSTIDWRIRLIVQIKDRKIRCLYYDNRNSYLSNDLPSGVYSFFHWYKEISENEYKLKRKRFSAFLTDFREDIKNDFAFIIKALEGKSSYTFLKEW